MKATGAPGGFRPPDPGDTGLNQLEYASGVDVQDGGVTIDSTELWHREDFENLQGRLWVIDDANARVHNNRGAALARLGRLEESLAAFDEGLQARGTPDEHARIRRNIELVERARSRS
ncbi:MAG TPA: tetratricopeptide repeat protein [Solirubrobacteraceae bacterium]|jgi:hypothetical protein|nr:tetratricopeptide repeat protein [Solirubrobacteraceae bacterium]